MLHLNTLLLIGGAQAVMVEWAGISKLPGYVGRSSTCPDSEEVGTVLRNLGEQGCLDACDSDGKCKYCTWTDQDYCRLYSDCTDASTQLKHTADTYKKGSLPTNYNVRSKGCSVEVLNQGGCGSCWAFGSSSALSDRFCLMGKNITLSPQSLVSCPDCRGSCKGGAEKNAVKYIATYGIQTCTDACTAGCEPYGSGKKPDNCTDDPDNDRCHGCDAQCHDGSKATRVKVDSTFVEGGLDGVDEHAVKTEIFKHGSVMGGLSVFGNWGSWVKKNGPDAVYTSHEDSAHIGAHAIKIIGWGVSQNVKYWLVQNSWGAGFGDDGTIKMLRGQDTLLPGVDRCLWNQASWAMPMLSNKEEGESEVPDYAAFSAGLDADASPLAQTGAWSQGDHTHSFWGDLAQKVFALSGVKGKFDAIEGVELQVVAGFNARFTVRTTDGFRAVISTSHGMENELLEAPVVESLIKLD